ncbi:hypothetical protein PInf_004794 [Phytophthora infestans]|nr:hypothetical protein PInf_004794 [Phytophthora infestans]
MKHNRGLAKLLLNRKTIDEVTKHCATDIACMYLLDTTKSRLDENGVTKRVFKFGYSKNVKDRMNKLVVKYGRDSVIDTLIFLLLDYLSGAETELKRTLGKKYTHKDGSET